MDAVDNIQKVVVQMTTTSLAANVSAQHALSTVAALFHIAGYRYPASAKVKGI